jgi:thiamine biosynthesis lipoprotein
MQNKKIKILFPLLCAFFIGPASAGICAAEPALQKIEDSRMAMGCLYSITAYGPDLTALTRSVNEAFDEIDRIDRMMSHYKQESPLSRLNREAGEQAVKTDPELFDFITECLRYSRESDGAFDITVGPLMKAWGFFRGEGRLPSDAELNRVKEKIGYRHVSLDRNNQTIRFAREGMELDLGGIAKGYAVDRAIAVLKKNGIERALVNSCGSTIYGLGAPPGQWGWRLQLQDPTNSRKSAGSVTIRNQALSVSGSYEKFFEAGGRRYSHIMDPRTGRPVEGVLSVAVITPDGTSGDALDNVFYVLGVETSRRRKKEFAAERIMFFIPSGKQWRRINLR